MVLAACSKQDGTRVWGSIPLPSAQCLDSCLDWNETRHGGADEYSDVGFGWVRNSLR